MGKRKIKQLQGVPGLDAPGVSQRDTAQANSHAAVQSRISRLIRIIAILHADVSTETSSLILQLGVSRRTFYRDLEVLRDAGAPIEYLRTENRYRLNTLGNRIAQTLTEAEVRAFLNWAAQRRPGIGNFSDPFDTAVSKLGAIIHEILLTVLKTPRSRTTAESIADWSAAGIHAAEVASLDISTLSKVRSSGH